MWRRRSSAGWRALIAEFKRVTGKENLLLWIAEASLTAPEPRVRDVVFPAVAGGEQTLRDVVAEFRSKGPTYRRTVTTSIRASYTSHYRKGLIQLLDACCSSAARTAPPAGHRRPGPHRPVRARVGAVLPGR
jgi:hypothetical protein